MARRLSHKSFRREFAKMVTNLTILGLMVFFGGIRAISSMAVGSSVNGTKNLTVKQEHKTENFDSTDLAVHNVLIEITNRIFRSDDSHLISLIKRGIVEAAKAKPSAPIEAGAKKAEIYVTEVTAAYTQAIFRASSASQAQEILRRFQDTIKRIVDYVKDGEFTSY